MSEIENRQNNSDGAASFERLIKDYSPGEMPPIGDNSPGFGVDEASAANDIAYQNKINKESTKPGNIVDLTGVTSVYDARPINAVDFIIPLFCDNTGPGTFTGNTIVIPSGITCILKWFSLEQVGITGGGTVNMDLLNQFGALLTPAKQFTILVNGIAQPNYTLLQLGPHVKRYPCYIFAPENSILEFQLTV